MNLLPIIAAAIASLAVGMIWYAPFAFGNAWMRLTGIHPGSPKKKNAMLWGFVSSLVAALVLGFMFQRAQVGVREALIIVLWMWVAFCVLLRMPHFFFEGRSMKLFWIDAFHDLVNLLVIGLIVSQWR